ncbi:MAG TPA: SDR family NAD(P)-dependent oxidoreductase [Terracidiphilus sp.]|nr:SDR family NAD(P)-dependent oxidoreductase [Terracidiphilus sp.]
MSGLEQRLRDMSAVKLALAAESARAKFDLINAEPIAVVGMSCRFPGGADDPESFWRLLRDGVDAVTEVPPERWDIDAYYDPDPEAVGRMYTRWGSFLRDVDRFDAAFFGISPREAALMDPQQRLMLEVSWEAIERAAVLPESLRSSRTGVFVGMMTLDYSRLLDGTNLMSPYAATGNGFAFTAGRLAYTLGLHGPAIAVDTACSSSLVAVHLACQSLRLNECETALAGGVNLSLSPISTLVQCRTRMLSPDGRCKTFDASANGYVKGEGCGVVVLRRLADAVRDGDRIVALIRGSAVNHDGASSGITVPNQSAQEQVIRSALERSGVAPLQVSYVEAHGTGTALGDPIETEALGAVYGEGREFADSLAIGSVKTNLGHLEGAAGIAGLIKAILALEYEEIPPHLHLQTPSPHIRWGDLPITVPSEPRPWKRGTRGRFAGVSSFGFSGTNAHIVLEEAPVLGLRQPRESDWRLFTLSGRTADAAENLVGQYVRYLEANSGVDLADLCFTANTGRTHFAHRISVVAHDARELTEKLRTLLAPAETPHRPQQIVSAASLHPEGHERRSMLEALAATYQTGASVDWTSVETERRRKLVLPTYPFERQRHWLEPAPATVVPQRPAASPGEHPLLGRRIPLPGSEEIRFESQLNADSPAFLKEHKVYGEVVVPAAVYLEMAVAAHQALGADCLLLEDIVFHQALRLSNESPVKVQLVSTPAEDHRRRWTIYAADNRAGDTQWRTLATGWLSTAERSERAPFTAAEAGADAQRLSAESHYEHLRLYGLEYGSAFRVLTDIKCSPGMAWGRIELSGALRSADANFFLHPVGLDACFQLCAAALAPQSQSAADGKASVPVSIERIRILGPFPVDGVRAHARILDASTNRGAMVNAEVRIHGMDGNLLVEIDGLAFRSVERKSLIVSSSLAEPDPVYEIEWKPQPLPNESAIHLLPPSLIKARMAASIDEIGSLAGANANLHLVTALEDLSLHFIAEGFLQLGWLYQPGGRFTTEGAAERLKVIPQYRRLMVRLLSALCDAGYLVREENGWFVNGPLPQGEARKAMLCVLETHPEAKAEIALLDRCASQWPAVVRGDCDPLSLLFPSGDSSDVAQIYRGSADLASLNSLIAEAIRTAGGDAPLKILEIGGGTGATTAQILANLEPGRTNYTFTDVSPALIAQARRTLSEHKTVEYRTLDIERSPRAQGFTPGAYNVVVAANVFHATRDLRETLQHVRELLAPNGVIVLLEATTPLRWLDLTFGLTSGWWRFDDRSLRSSYPLLSSDSWARVLDTSGFRDAVAIEPIPNHAILIAKTAARPRRWLLAGPANEFVERFSTSLLESGDECILRADHPDAEGFFEAMRRTVEQAQPDGVVFLWGLDAPEAPIAGDGSTVLEELPHAALQCTGWALRSIQAIIRASVASPPSLFLVTHGAVSAEGSTVRGVAQAPLWGLGAVAALEHPELSCKLIDLGSTADVDAATALFAELRAASNENRVSLGASRRSVARLVPGRRFSKGSGSLNADGTYLIAGGFGGLGLLTASWLVSKGARNLILVGRRGLHHEARAAVRALEASGALVRVESIDISQSADLERMLADIAHSLPPLRGVIHAAGSLDDGIILEQTPERFASLFASKVTGSWSLHRLTLGLPLDFFVLFSSAASLVGRPGQSNHAAANAFMDSLAHHRRANGLPALSVNWGAWSRIGKAVEVEADRILEFEGAGAIDPKEGLEILDKLLASTVAQAGVLPMNWELFLRKHPARAAMPLLEELLRADDRTTVPHPDSVVSLRTQFLTVPGPERNQWIATYLQERVRVILGLHRTSCPDPHQPLQELGFDSLMGIELKSRVNQDFGINLPIVDFMETPTIYQLGRRLEEQLSLAERVILTNDVSDPALDLITL